MVVLEDSSVPLYVQIYRQLKEIMVTTGRIPPGAKLPSARRFARTLNVSRNTVEAAYQQLYAEGYVESKARQGFFAAEFDRTVLTGCKTAVFNAASLPSGGPNGNYRYDFRPRRVDMVNFPFPLWSRLINRCIKDYPESLVSYGHQQGNASLRAKIAGFLAEYRGISCSPEQIVLCAGTQNALTQVCQLLQGSFAAIAMEEPGSFGARVVFQNHGLQIIPVAVEQDGIDIGQLQSSKAGAIYVTPSRQFPSGVVMSVAKRAKLLDWAARNKAWIFEDDYNAYFRHNARPIPALRGMSGSDRVIYLGSFAQALFPAARISYLVLPQPLLPQFLEMYRYYDSPVSGLFQKALELFMEQGYFERHIRKMNQIYKKKHDMLVKALKEKLGGYIELSGGNTGLHVLLTVNDSVSEQLLIDRAAEAGVMISSIARHWQRPRDCRRATILLSFGGIDLRDIQPAAEMLAKAWLDEKMEETGQL